MAFGSWSKKNRSSNKDKNNNDKGTPKKKNKYFNVKTEIDGYKFDSKREAYAYKLFKQEGVRFEMQVPIELTPTYTDWKGDTVRRMKAIVDYTIDLPDGTKVVFDTKGLPTQEAILKFKLLGYNWTKSGIKHEIHWAKTDGEVQAFVAYILEKIKK